MQLPVTFLIHRSSSECHDSFSQGAGKTALTYITNEHRKQHLSSGGYHHPGPSCADHLCSEDGARMETPPASSAPRGSRRRQGSTESHAAAAQICTGSGAVPPLPRQASASALPFAAPTLVRKETSTLKMQRLSSKDTAKSSMTLTRRKALSVFAW